MGANHAKRVRAEDNQQSAFGAKYENSEERIHPPKVWAEIRAFEREPRHLGCRGDRPTPLLSGGGRACERPILRWPYAAAALPP